jgi:hypothetical protein
MLLDSLGIYGPNVWVIFKDVCEQNHARMSQCCGHTVGHVSSEALRFQTGSTEMKEK